MPTALTTPPRRGGCATTPASLRALLGAGRRALARTLLPASCALCGGRSDEALCDECHTQFFGADVARCRLCANPLAVALGTPHDAAARSAADIDAAAVSSADRDQLCGHCLSQRPAFDATLVAADYAVPLDQLVLQLKFGGRIALAVLFARCLRDAVLQRPGFVLPELLCPVPLGPQRLAQRGYNQALEIARPLAQSLGVALHPRLAQRVHDTTAQSRVTPGQRRRNIAHAFAITDGALVEGRHIGIVDDVMTSGQTLNELAATFTRYGAARVTNLVFARTPPHH